jgi:hypothetical protein
MHIHGYPADLGLERQSCPWILSWAGRSEAGGFGHESSFGISVQTRSAPLPSLDTYEDVYTLGGTIDYIYNLSINLRDTTQDMTSSFDHWSNQWNNPPLQGSTRWACKILSLGMSPSHKCGEFYLCNNKVVQELFVSF